MKMFRIFYWLVLCLFTVLALISIFLTVVSTSPGYLTELASHFRLAYLSLGVAYLMLILLGIVLVKIHRIQAFILCALAFLLIGLNCLDMLRYYQPKPPVADASIAQKFKILHINVLGINRNPKVIEQLIRDTKPDILTLAEYNSRWQKELEQSGVLKQFRSTYVVKYGNDGIYSTFPFESVKVEYVKPGQDSTTKIHLKIAKEPVTLLVVHPRPPVKPLWYERNRNHFAYWEKHWSDYGENLLLIGDLNNTPWSYTFRHFIANSKLHDSQLGFGLQPSWPVKIPESPIQFLPPLIPIDHVLYSDRFVVLSRKTGPRDGSDHLPVIVEMGVLKR